MSKTVIFSNKWHYILLFVICNIFQSAFSISTNNFYSIDYISTDQGLSHSDVLDILQDNLGYIWIGTNSGLDRYDGNKIIPFYNSLDAYNNTLHNRIYAISYDNDRHIWLATISGIQCFDIYQQRYIPVNVNDENNAENYESIIYYDNRLYTINSNGVFSIFSILGDGKLKKEYVSLNAHCTCLYKDPKDMIWIGTRDGIFKIDKNQQFIKIKSQQIKNVSSIIIDKNWRLWISSNNSIFCYSKVIKISGEDNDELEQGMEYNLPGNKRANKLVQSSDGTIWASSTNGLFLMSDYITEKQFKPITSVNPYINLTSDYIYSLCPDKNGNLFIGTFSGGLNILHLYNFPFNILQQRKQNIPGIKGKIVRAIAEYNHLIYIGTNDEGITVYDKSNGEYKYINHSNNKNLRSDNIRALYVDKENKLWIGHTEGIDIMDLKNGSFYNKTKSDELPVIRTSLIISDRFDNIWCGTVKGACRITKNENSNYNTLFLSDYDSLTYRPAEIVSINSDKRYSELLYSTENKLMRILLDKNGEIDRAIEYRSKLKHSAPLSSFFISSIIRENDTTAWIGTIGGKFNKMIFSQNDDYHAIPYINDKSISWRDVEGMILDDDKNIWIAGGTLAKYSITSHKMWSYKLNRPDGGLSFKIGALCKGKSGTLYFGGNNGLVYFNPRQIKDNPYPAKSRISDMTINNKELSSEQRDDFFRKKIILNYNENNIIFSFSSLHYNTHDKSFFRYRLEGYESNDVITDQTMVAYPNLPHGKYELNLEASNNDGLWSGNIERLSIIIRPPWWLTTNAKIGYVFVSLLLAIIVLYYAYRMIILKNKIKLTLLQEEQKEKMHQMQLNFFTNISHEFRTPLTLMIGALEQLQENIGLKNKESYNLLSRNSHRLLGLINELMDFRKAESKAFNLHVSENNMTDFVSKIVADFKIFASQKNIIFNYSNQTGLNNWCWFDINIMEKILLNILNNAFKYSSTEGSVISLEVFFKKDIFYPQFSNSYKIDNEYKAEKYIFFRISDNGPGISRESIETVFERYYQIEDSAHDPHLGSGVGLALVKSLVIIHKGYLEVYSERDRGTEFLIAIPCGENDFTKNEKYQIKEKDLFIENNVLPPLIVNQHKDSSLLSIDTTNKEFSNKLLIVDDNDEIREMLRNSLRYNYNVLEAIDGLDALNVIKNDTPEIILCDLMMPNMNGIELCRKIKSETAYSHIPFILLTAKDDENTQLSSLEVGADAFLTKPVSIKMLNTVLSNLEIQKERLKNNISSNYINNALLNNVHQNDKTFYNKLIECIDLNIGKEDFDVNYICDYFSMSRSKLYQRVKEVASLPVNELIRQVRLHKAARLMAEENCNVSEVLSKIGMKHQSYFTSCFKKEFGVSPSEFIRQIKNSQK
ncbi:MAG: two-component regulator propeller domain-containing protein [Bacteroidales bacterium]|nr:two-component regulator propeller domain-containing protein [Bacteroidales bacterium]